MICELQPLPGPCGARYIRWYYNRHAQECTYFRYGGCQGNQNNFKSKSDCESACVSVPTISLYQGSQSSLSDMKPAIRTAPIYEPPEVKYEALNSIMISGNEKKYDPFSATRYRKMQNDDDSNTRKRRRLEKERAKERRRKEKRKERKRLKRLRRRQRKLLREGKKSKKDKKKKKKTKGEGGVDVTDLDNAVTAENQVNTVEEISNIVDNAISDEDSEQKRRREERRKRRKKRQKRPKKNKDGKIKKQKRDNKPVERQYRRHAPSYQNDDNKSYRMLSILDHIASSKTQSGSIVYTEQWKWKYYSLVLKWCISWESWIQKSIFGCRLLK